MLMSLFTLKTTVNLTLLSLRLRGKVLTARFILRHLLLARTRRRRQYSLGLQVTCLITRGLLGLFAKTIDFCCCVVHLLPN